MAHTIVAQATATGLSGLSVIRVSGDEAFQISDRCFRGKKKIVDAKTHTILYGEFVDSDELLDNVTVSIFHAPHSYTGENTVEFGVHGGTIVPMKIIETLMNCGCKHAEPGEFTRRAFMNGKINLVQAEAVVDIIHAISVPSSIASMRQFRGGLTDKLTELRNKLIEIASMLELELDFVEEEISFVENSELCDYIEKSILLCQNISNTFKASNILREGFFVAIAGKPNSGKSTLFNALLNKERAIVSNIPGTTRDYITENIIINNIPVKLIDTAGLRETDDIVEIAGIKFAQNTLEQANLILFLNDISLGENDSDELFEKIKNNYPNNDFLLVQNKCDLISKTKKNLNDEQTIYISANNCNDVELLKKHIGNLAEKATANTNDILLNERQYFKLLETENSLQTAKQILTEGAEPEIISIEIKNAGRVLGEITGETWSEEVLNSIFAKFCIGK